MNRNDEFTEFMKELDGRVPEVGESIKRGSRRKARKQFLYQPLMGLTAMFMLFVLSVNLFTPVAMACAKVPVLKDLTKAVAFSKSLKAALENDYVQGVELKQTKDDVTVEITSMMVDHRKLIVFYRFESDKYDRLAAQCTVPSEENPNYPDGEIFTSNYNDDVPNEEIRYAVTDFLAGEIPETVQFHMKVWNSGAYFEDVTTGAFKDEMQGWDVPAENYHITDFAFELKPDFTKVAEAVTYEVNQTLEMDGQKFTVTGLEVYPTYMNISMVEAPENSASLTYLHFYVINEDGERFGDGCVGLCGGRKIDGTYVISAESPYFYEGKISRMVITGAEWLDSEKERTYVNLETGATENLPENVTLKEIRKTDGTVCLVFDQTYLLRMDDATGDPFGKVFMMPPFMLYYDAEGNQYTGEGSIDVGQGTEQQWTGESGVYEFALGNYPYDEVWLDNIYSSIWYADEKVTIDFK